MTDAEMWLRGRIEGVPPALFEAMTAALPAAGLPVPVSLARGALDLYSAVARGSGGRDDALPLLAADALFTHAFEAQAEIEPAGIDRLVELCEQGLGEIAS